MSSILAFDHGFESLLFSVRSPLGVEAFKAITFLGETITVIGIAGVIAGSLWYAKAYRPYIAGLAVTLGGAAASVYAFKELVARARPDVALRAIVETGYSFPSWHATASIALYGFIIFLSWRLYSSYRWSVAVVFTLLILAIGFSRLYLGVHYPTDVLGGFVLGGAWLALGAWVTRRLCGRQTPQCT